MTLTPPADPFPAPSPSPLHSPSLLVQALGDLLTAARLMQGLKVLHDCGWAHMDLKPSKVQVRMGSDGATPHCTIVDLGASVGKLPPPQSSNLRRTALPQTEICTMTLC